MSTINLIAMENPYKEMDDVLSLYLDIEDDGYKLPDLIGLESEYTFSIWHKSASENVITFNLFGTEYNVNSNTEWQKYVCTFTITALDNVDILITPQMNIETYLYEAFLSEGNMDMSWTPAPEDEDDKFAEIRIDLNKITSTVFDPETGQSKIEQTATEIRQEVESKTTGKAVIASINADTGTATIEASHINLVGAVTADCIATNAVTAEKIDVEDLFTQDITATGNFDLGGNGVLTYDASTDSLSIKAKELSLLIGDVDTKVSDAISDAAKTATNYLNYSNGSLVIGDLTGSSLGRNIKLDTDSLDIRRGVSVLASYADNTIDLAKHSKYATISLCNNTVLMRYYKSGVSIDENGTSTDVWNFKIESADSIDINSTEGGVSLIGNDIFLNATTEVWVQGESLAVECDSYFTNNVDVEGHLSAFKTLYLGDPSLSTNSAISTYWEDGALHYILQRNTDGLTSAFGWAGGSGYSTITKIRGQTCQYQNSSGTTTLSDERLKKDFTNLDNWENFYNALEPCAFKMKTGNSGRFHMGFKAQQVEQALIDNELTTQDFAGFIKMKYYPDEDNPESNIVYKEAGINSGDDELGLIYTEFIAMNTDQIQKLKRRFSQEIDKLKEEINFVKEQIKI